MASTTTHKNGKKEERTTAKSGGKLEKLPEPVTVDGWFLMAEGNMVCGTILARDEGDYGGFYKIKTTKACKCKSRDDDDKTLPAGSVVAVNENAKLRQLRALVAKGPTYVEIMVLGPKADGRGWELDVGHRTAF